MAGHIISIETANAMVSDYDQYMRNLGVDMDEQTQSVSFTGNDLMDWLNGVMGSADELRIFMGRYPDGPNAGRTSVILWPYLDGQPAQEGSSGIEPFNEGSGQP